METKIIRVGSSVGLIIPENVAKEAALKIGTKVDIAVNRNEEIVIKKSRILREGWDKAFAIYAKDGEGEQMIPDCVENESDILLY